MDATQEARVKELEEKASGPGLSGEEANELGKLYAIAENATYSNAETAGNTEELELEEKQQLIKDKQLSKEEWAAMDQGRSRISFKEGGVRDSQ